jgi:hypothetical protein
MADPYDVPCGPSDTSSDQTSQIYQLLDTQQQQLISVMLPIYTQIDQQLKQQQSELAKVQKQVTKVVNKRLNTQQTQLDNVSSQLYAQIAARVTEQGIRLNLLQEQLATCRPGQIISGQTGTPGSVSEVFTSVEAPTTNITNQGPTTSIGTSQQQQATADAIDQVMQRFAQLEAQLIQYAAQGQPIPQSVLVNLNPQIVQQLQQNQTIGQRIGVPANPPQALQPPATPPPPYPFVPIQYDPDAVQPQQGERIVDPILEPIAWQFGGFNRRWRSLVNNYMGEWWIKLQGLGSLKDLPALKRQMMTEGK